MDALRDDLEAALATVDTELSDKVEDVTPEVTPEDTYEDTHEDTPDVSADGDSGVIESPESPPLQGGTEAKPPSSKNSMKAPLNWKPQHREDWSRIPRHLQEVITNREKEIASTIANTKEARRLHEQFSNLTHSYAPVLAAEGVQDPMQAVDSLFRTVAQLRMGSSAQKAQVLADMINAYSVDINELDSVLSGSPRQASQDGLPPHLEQLLEQKLAPVNQLMQGLTEAQQRQASTIQQQAAGQVQEFAKDAEFLEDVRYDMADLIDTAAKRGYKMPLQEAYTKACLANPDIAATVRRRQQQSSLQGKQHAASSIGGRQAGMGGGGSDMSLRDALANAWDSSSR